MFVKLTGWHKNTGVPLVTWICFLFPYAFLSFLFWDSSLNSQKQRVVNKCETYVWNFLSNDIVYFLYLFPSNSEWDLTNRPLDKLQELLYIQV